MSRFSKEAREERKANRPTFAERMAEVDAKHAERRQELDEKFAAKRESLGVRKPAKEEKAKRPKPVKAEKAKRPKSAKLLGSLGFTSYYHDSDGTLYKGHDVITNLSVKVNTGISHNPISGTSFGIAVATYTDAAGELQVKTENLKGTMALKNAVKLAAKTDALN